MRTRIGSMLAAGVAALVLAGGCGSDDDSTSESEASEPLTHGELVDQATAACRTAHEKSDEINEKLGDTDPFSEEATPLLVELVAVTETLVGELGELDPPAEDAEAYGTLVDELQSGADDLTGVVDAVGDGDAEEAQRLQEELNDRGSTISGALDDLGLQACAA